MDYFTNLQCCGKRFLDVTSSWVIASCSSLVIWSWLTGDSIEIQRKHSNSVVARATDMFLTIDCCDYFAAYVNFLFVLASSYLAILIWKWNLPEINEFYTFSEDLTETLPAYVKATWPDGIVKVVRTEERGGLIRAKVNGAKAATGDVIIFLDAHCECGTGWWVFFIYLFMYFVL